MMTTMQAIIDLQRPFFPRRRRIFVETDDSEDVWLNDTGLDISTISRVSSPVNMCRRILVSIGLKFFFR
ncbi:hypothetical protein NXW09_28355 [Bacteroides ovatus]|nr:hypothetical protein [Bacteroides ovatus]